MTPEQKHEAFNLQLLSIMELLELQNIFVAFEDKEGTGLITLGGNSVLIKRLHDYANDLLRQVGPPCFDKQRPIRGQGDN